MGYGVLLQDERCAFTGVLKDKGISKILFLMDGQRCAFTGPSSAMVCEFLLISHTFVGRLPSHMASEGGQHEKTEARNQAGSLQA